MRLHRTRTIVAVLVASMFYVVLVSPIASFFPDRIAIGVVWYPGLYLALALCFAFTRLIDWWRYLLFVATTSFASFVVVLLAAGTWWFPYLPTIKLMLVSAFGALIFASLLRWVIGIPFLTRQRMLILAACASFATLIAHIVNLPISNSLRVPYVLTLYPLFWWWGFVAALLWIQQEDDSTEKGTE